MRYYCFMLLKNSLQRFNKACFIIISFILIFNLSAFASDIADYIVDTNSHVTWQEVSEGTEGAVKINFPDGVKCVKYHKKLTPKISKFFKTINFKPDFQVMLKIQKESDQIRLLTSQEYLILYPVCHFLFATVQQVQRHNLLQNYLTISQVISVFFVYIFLFVSIAFSQLFYIMKNMSLRKCNGTEHMFISKKIKTKLTVNICIGIIAIFIGTPGYATLYDAIKDSVTTIYSLTQDETIPSDIGAMGTSTFTIEGGNFTINGNGHGGMSVSAGQTLNIYAGIWRDFYATTAGGIVHNRGALNIIANTENIYFSNNISSAGDGVITAGNITNIEGANGYKVIFENNSAIQNPVIGLNHTVNIKNAEFNNNVSRSGYGGALGHSATPVILTISNTTFSSNSSASMGGAIYLGNKNDVTTITNSTFTSNSASTNGGAIYNRGTVTTLSGSSFAGNSAGTNGGAIYNTGVAEVKGAYFESNISSDIGGGIYNLGTMTIDDCTFDGNSAGTFGGAIYNAGTVTSIEDSDFIENYINANSNGIVYGSAVANVTNGNIGDISGDFIGNYTINTSTRTSCKAFGAVSNVNGAADVVTKMGDITGSFVGNYVESGYIGYGGAIGNYANNATAKIEIGDITANFSGNYVKATSMAYGGAIVNVRGVAGATITMGDITGDFISNYVESTNNNAYGGAITNGAGSTIKSISGDFMYNTATSTSGLAGGGAIYNDGTIGSINSDFNNNSAGNYGGAIYNAGTYNAGIINSISGTFSNNSAQYGGAIYNTGTMTITNSLFENNSAGSQGGAIRAQGGNLTIIDTDFLNNKSTGAGGAICSTGTLYIQASLKNVTFSGNIGTAGADIHSNYGNVRLNTSLDKSINFGSNVNIYNGYSEVDKGILDINNLFYGDVSGTVNFNNTLYVGNILNICGGTTNFAKNVSVTNATNITGGVVNLYGNLTSPRIVNESDLNVYSASAVTIKGALTSGVGSNLVVNGSNGVTDYSGKVTLDTRNVGIEANTLGNLTLNTDLNYTFDMNLADKVADTLDMSGTLIANSHSVVVDRINVLEGNIRRSSTVNLTDSPDLAQIFTPNGGDWKAIVKYSDGTAYTGKNVAFNPATGDLRFVNFGLSNGTIDKMTAKSETYLDSAHDIITLSDTQGANTHSVYIDGTPYYFTTTDENLNALVTTGNCAIKETVANDSTAVLTYGGKYYTYDYDKLPISNYETSVVENPESGADYHYSETDSEGNTTYYNIDIPAERLGKSDRLNWVDSTAEEALDGDTLKDGYMRIEMAKANGEIEYKYYKYVYTGRRNRDASLGASIKALGYTKALGNGSADDINNKNKSHAKQSNSGSLSALVPYCLSAFSKNSREGLQESTSNGKETASQTYKRIMQEQQMEFVRAAAYGSKNHPKPCVLSAPIAAQVGGYLTQVNSYDQAFTNLDMEMMNSSSEKALGQEGTKALGNSSAGDININKNKSHAKQSNSGSLSALMPYCLSAFSKNSREGLSESNSDNGINRDGKGLWNRAYATFERVHLTSGPTVGNIAYGNFFGGDMGKKELRNGWKRQFSAYIGYNGSTQDFDRQSIDQNGGTLGVMETWYKGNFFTALTANVSGNFADANTDIGKERMAMIMAGVAWKTGYNFEIKLRRKALRYYGTKALGDGSADDSSIYNREENLSALVPSCPSAFIPSIIIQPSILLSYSFVHTFAHNNGLGSRVHSSPLNAIQVAPGIKFIANLKNGWQPYLGVNMRWNIIDKTSFNIREVNIPDMSIHPYVEYGIGLQKRWGERFTGYAQTMIRNGARNGVMLSVGLRWAIGK